jgi:hypothetical protein
VLSESSGAEKDLVRRCLQSAVSGELFDLNESEYHIGMSEIDLRRVVAAYPAIDDTRYESHGFLALDLCLSLASQARRSGSLSLIPESASVIEMIRAKIIGRK